MVEVPKETIIADACGRWDRRAAAKALNVSPQTLANWRTLGRGPTPFVVAGRAYYRPAEVVAFANGEAVAA